MDSSQLLLGSPQRLVPPELILSHGGVDVVLSVVRQLLPRTGGETRGEGIQAVEPSERRERREQRAPGACECAHEASG